MTAAAAEVTGWSGDPALSTASKPISLRHKVATPGSLPLTGRQRVRNKTAGESFCLRAKTTY